MQRGLISFTASALQAGCFNTHKHTIILHITRRKKEEAAKKKEQAKILGKGRAKLSFSFG